MSDAGVTIAGVRSLVDSLGVAATALDDLTPAGKQAAGVVLGVVDPPRRTGALASTVEADVDALGFTLRAGGERAPYGPIVHARNPFLTRALTARESDVVDAYAEQVDQAVGLVTGD